MKNKRFAVISIHYTTKCNMQPRCSFCYKNKSNEEKPLKFWYDLVPYLKQLTNQIACGGGEPFTNVPFIKNLGRICKKNKIILNITSNGRLLMKLSDKELKEVLKDITMVSISYDDYKVKTKKDMDNYIKLVQRIKKITKCQVGSNLLVSERMFKDNGIVFKKLVDMLFTIGCDRVFALIMKNYSHPDILKFKLIYQILSIKYKHFYIDDCGKMILENNSYSNWKNKCHRGTGLISINEEGGISTCSFAQPFTYLKKPSDILKIKIPKKEMGTNNCPFLKIK